MPTNETIIAVPITLDQPGQVRQFLVRLVEKLDIVLGYRGDDPYVTSSQLQSVSGAASTGLTQLEQTILNIITQLLTENSDVVTQLVNTVSEDTADAIDALKSPDTVTDSDNSTQVISNPPTQTEVQNIQDQVVTNANRFDDLLTALRGTGIIAT